MSEANLQIIISAKDMTGEQWRNIQRSIRTVNSEVNNMNKNATGAFNHARDSIGGATLALGKMNAALNMISFAAVAYGAYELSKSFLAAGVAADKYKRVLEGVSSSPKAAADDLKWLEEKADKYGLIFEDMTRGYSLLSVSMQDTEFAGAGTRKMFDDLMKGMVAYQLSADDAYEVTRAIQQIFSKGTIQAEEFRRQFSERIPSAFKAIQKELGKSGREIGEAMKAGLLTADEIMPRLLDHMGQMSKASADIGSKSLQSEINRIKNSWFALRRDIMQGGISDALAEEFGDMAQSVRDFLRENDQEILNFAKGFVSVSGSTIETISQTLTTVKEIVNNTVVQVFGGLGLIGFFLFGTKYGPAALIAISAAATANWVSAASKVAGIVAGGSVGLKEFANAKNTEDLNDIVNKFEKKQSDSVDYRIKDLQPKLQKINEELIETNDLLDKLRGGSGRLVDDNPAEKMGKAFDISKAIETQIKLLAEQEKIYKEIADRRKKLGVIDFSGFEGDVTEFEVKRGEIDWGKKSDGVAKNTKAIREHEKALKEAEEAARKLAEAHEWAFADSLMGAESDQAISNIIDIFGAVVKKGNEAQAELVASSREMWGKIYAPGFEAIQKQKEAVESAMQEAADTIGNAFSSAFQAGIRGGIEDGMAGVADTALNLIGEKISTGISDSLQKSLGSALTTSMGSFLGPILGSLGGGIAGGILGEIGNSIFGGGDKASKQRIEAEMKVAEELQKNTAATLRQNELLINPTSSYSGDISGILDSFINDIDSMFESFGNARYSSVGDKLSSYSGSAPTSGDDYFSRLSAQYNELRAREAELLARIQSAEVVFNVDDYYLEWQSLHNAIIPSLSASIENFSAKLKEVSKGVTESAGALYLSEADKITPQYQVENRGFEKSAMDSVLGLAEVYRTFGVISEKEFEAVKERSTYTQANYTLLLALSDSQNEFNAALEMGINLVSAAALIEEERAKSISDVNQAATLYVDELQGGLTPLEQAIGNVNDKFNDWKEELIDLGGATDMLSAQQNEALASTRALYDEFGNLKEAALTVTDYLAAMSGMSKNVGDWQTSLIRESWGASDWIGEFNRLGTELGSLNIESVDYFSDAVDLAEQQFDALKEILSISKQQLVALTSTKDSLEEQIWDITSGKGSDSVSMDEWIKRGQGLYAQAMTGDVDAISDLQSFLVDIKDVMLAGGYGATQVESMFSSALQDILGVVNSSINNLNNTVNNASALAPKTNQSGNIEIRLIVDGKTLSSVIVDQLNTNTTLRNAVAAA